MKRHEILHIMKKNAQNVTKIVGILIKMPALHRFENTTLDIYLKASYSHIEIRLFGL